MMLNNWFKRDENKMSSDELKTYHNSKVSLQGRTAQMLEDYASRHTRYSRIPQRASCYYYY